MKTCPFNRCQGSLVQPGQQPKQASLCTHLPLQQLPEGAKGARVGDSWSHKQARRKYFFRGLSQWEMWAIPLDLAY